MTKLRTRLVRYLIKITAIAMALIWVTMLILQIRDANERTYKSAQETFVQVEQILEQNSANLAEIEKDYSETCLANAETIAYILQNRPEIMEKNDFEEINKIAKMVQVDEIDVFNKEGVIVFSTNPDYLGYSFDSGEQISFFKPLLEDQSLRLVQEITPNTATGMMVQYSALWSENKQFIVQVGMFPENVLEARESSELSFIFSLLKANPGVDLYAIDEKTGKILGSTDEATVGRHQDYIGLTAEMTAKRDTGFHCTVHGVNSYTVVAEKEGVLVAYVVPISDMYESTLHSSLFFALGLFLIAQTLVFAKRRYLQTYVLDEINTINTDLNAIEKGNLDVYVDVKSSQEFAQLSTYINDMVRSLVESQRQIEKDRDMDMLTGLFNRRGMDNELLRLQKAEVPLGHYAAVMIDADKLKTVNDVYGHEDGDAYLCRIGEVLDGCGTKKQITSRQGGDEFVVFLYGYDDEASLDAAIDELKSRQDGRKATLKSGIVVEMAFSLGCCKGTGPVDYDEMLKVADERMYENKRNRRGDDCRC